MMNESGLDSLGQANSRAAITVRVAEEATAYYRSDHCPDDGSSHEVGQPMDGHGNAEADIERVSDGNAPQPPLFRKQGEEGSRHGKRDRGMGRRPSPKNAAAQKTE